jgi:hypothetical protein
VGTRCTRGNRLGGTDCVCQHALRGNPQHPEPVLFQKLCARVVPLGPITHVVGNAIDFDDQPFRKAAKVDDIGAERMLPAKLETSGPQPQLLP